jgi:hypothetical protein
MVMKKAHYLQSLLALSAALGFVATAGASGTTLDITEVSDTTLDFSLQGGPIFTATSLTSDSWTFQLPTPGGTLSAAAWTEPDNSSEFNIVSIDPTGTVTVQSDVGNPNADPVNGNDTTSLVNGIYVTFKDDGDGSASVPDAASTMMLLAGCVAGLFVVGGRYRRVPVRI